MAHFRTSPAARRSVAVLRACLLAGAVSTLAGCYGPPKPLVLYPEDYRERHPIALREGARTVEVFVGRSRGGLSPAQRADVAAFAANWKHNATSGILVDVPRGSTTKQAAAYSLREIYSIFSASGVPSRAVRERSYMAADLATPSIKLSYGELTAHAGPCGFDGARRHRGDLVVLDAELQVHRTFHRRAVLRLFEKYPGLRGGCRCARGSGGDHDDEHGITEHTH